MDQLKTQWKYKLPKDHSYPLGNKEISETLHGCPLYDQLKLRFEYQDCYWASEYRKKLKNRQEIVLLEASFSAFRAYDDGWTICVVALPSVYRSNAHKQLKEHALPELQAWLEKNGRRKLYEYSALRYRYDLYREILIADQSKG